MTTWEDLNRLIRVIARPRLDPGRNAILERFLGLDVPWGPLIQLAETEGVAGFLHSHLAGKNIPVSVRKRLANHFAEIRRSGQRMISEAAALSAALEQKGLSVIALQGLSILDLYAEPGLRPLGDMDLLARPDQKEAVKAALQERGYRVSGGVYPDIFYRDGLWIDLHTHVLNLERIETRTYLFPRDLSALWVRAKPMFTPHSGILRPDPWDNFVLLSVHALKHGYLRILWIADLNMILTHTATSSNGWYRVIERARFWCQEKTTLYGLIILEGTLGVRVPGWVKQALGSQKLNPAENYLLRLKLNGFSSQEYGIFLWLFAVDGFSRRIRYLFETLFPKPPIMDQIYSHRPAHRPLARRVHRMLEAGSTLWQNGRRAVRISLRKAAPRR